MTEQMIEDLFAKRQIITLNTMVSPNQKLTFRQLQIYYQGMNIDINEKFFENLGLLKSDGEYNYTAFLFADINGVSIKIATYAGKDKTDLIETREYGYQCLLTATKNILDRLDSENRTYAKVTSTTRIERERINSIALREAVVNAIVHNDYALGFPLIEIFANRIEVTSCGGLVPGLTIENLFKCRSMPRNRELMRVFKDMNYVEQIGSGMSKILKVYKPSIFDINSSFTTVTFPFEDKPINSKEIASEKNRQKMLNVLSIINEKPEVTTSEIAEILNENHTTTRRRLIIYQEMGLISREGSRKTGKWVINRVVTEQNGDEQ